MKLAKKLGIFSKRKIMWYRKKISALGVEERPVIAVTLWLKGRKIATTMTVSDRKDLSFPVIIGRVDLDGFLVDPQVDPLKRREAQKW